MPPFKRIYHLWVIPPAEGARHAATGCNKVLPVGVLVGQAADIPEGGTLCKLCERYSGDPGLKTRVARLKEHMAATPGDVLSKEDVTRILEGSGDLRAA